MTNPPNAELEAAKGSARAMADVTEFLARHHCFSLATAGPEGIWAATVFYANRGFDLYFLSGAKTRHVRNIDAAPQVAGTINDDVEDWLSIRGVQIEGRAERVDDSRRREVLEMFDLRYPFPDQFWWAENGTTSRKEQRIYRVRPSRLFFMDHRRSGSRFEIPTAYLGP